MKKLLMRIVIILSIIVLAVIIYILGILIINSVNDYKPQTMSVNTKAGSGAEIQDEKSTFSIISWNIGYAGLGAKSDFFYDGGKMTMPEKADYKSYLHGILERIESFDSPDFILFQEVDTSSARSYRVNQYELIKKRLPLYSSVFAKNYDVSFVPVPVFNPMANVVSGLATYSRYDPVSTSQVVFPGNFAWPTRLFMLDRCFLLSIFEVQGSKKLYIINTHNSAFDDGSLRDSQLGLLYEYMLRASENGDYVVAGGDWNMNPAGYSNTVFASGDLAFKLQDLPLIIGPGSEWQIAFNTIYPTNRKVSSAYDTGKTYTTIIDYFICSPNIEILEVDCLYDGFENSDHHPVLLRFKLK